MTQSLTIIKKWRKEVGLSLGKMVGKCGLKLNATGLTSGHPVGKHQPTLENEA